MFQSPDILLNYKMTDKSEVIVINVGKVIFVEMKDSSNCCKTYKN